MANTGDFCGNSLKGDYVMKNRKVTKVLAAVLTGAMLMATPSVAMAEPWYSGWSGSSFATSAAVPAVQNLAVTYDRGTPYLTWTPIQLTDSQYMYIEYSSNPAFPDTDETSYLSLYNSHPAVKSSKMSFEDIADYSYNNDIIKPGRTIYYRAVVLDYSNAQYVDGKMQYNVGAYSNVVSHALELGKIFVPESRATKKQVYFKFVLDDFTGVEIYRAEGTKKYEKVATTTDAEYTDKNLKAETTYRYRLRGYVLDQTTQEKNYGDYVYLTKTTWGSDLDVEAKAKDAKTVKLTWDKVKGATEYRIYRQVGEDNDYTVKDGKSAANSKWRLLDTVKASKDSYKDKKLKSGLTYSYKVEAVKETRRGSKVTDTMLVSGIDDITLGFNGFESIREVKNADGSVTLKWKKLTGVEGYKIYMTQKVKNAQGYTEPVDVEVGTLPATATSYTCQPVADTTNWYDSYTIYAYSGNDYDEHTVSVPVIRVDKVNGISAVPNAALDGITVSWTPVPGAAYYKVYRTRTMSNYNADSDSYSYDFGYGTALQVQKTTGTLSADGTYYETAPDYTTEITGTSIIDTYLGYADKYGDSVRVIDVQDGPKQGVRYYYYVRAYATNGQPIDSDNYEVYESTRSSKPASAVLNNVTANKPEIKKVKAEGKGKVEVTWKKSAGADKYIVYYSTKKKSGYTYGGITTGNKLTIKNLTPGKTYYFQVKGVEANAAGGDVYSSLSKAKSVKVR